MLLRSLVEFVFVMLLARAFWRLVGRAVQGLASSVSPEARRAPAAPAPPAQGVHMERDPVCGTFVVPDSALSIADGRSRVYFCSPDCRDRYRARTA